MPFKDPEQKKAYQKKYHVEWYKKNKNSRYKQIKDREKSIRDKFSSYKSSKSCSKCGENTPVSLDFHHIKDNKRKNVSYMVSNGFGWDSLIKEMAKCVVLCSNCHRIEHYESKNAEKQ